METETEPKLFNKPRIGRRYEVSQRTVDNWMKDGILPYHKLGPKCVRFDPAECDKAIAKFRVKAKGAK
jgi:predicted DNA-binding transcriptional regulator AlpA